MKVGPTLVRTYKIVHTWVGIVSGVVLFIAFYAGAFTMFKPEIGQWAEARVDLDRVDREAPIDALAAAFLRQRDPSIASATLVLDPARAGHGHLRYRDGKGEQIDVTLDAAGQLHMAAARTRPAGTFVDDVHRNGGLPLNVHIAEPIIGLVAMLYALALVSGVVVLLPSLVKDLLLLRIGANAKRMWLDAHNLIGITSLPFHLVIALTSAGFCLHDWVYDTQDATIHALAKPEVKPEARPAGARVRSVPPAQFLPPSSLLASARSRSATFSPLELTYRGLNGPKPSVNIGGADPSGHTRSPRMGYMNLHPVTGKINRGPSLEPHAQSNWEATLSGIFALHFGGFGGAPVRVAYAVMGVLGAILFYTGNLLWIESRLRKNRQASGPLAQPRHVRWVAALTVGLCLGALIGLPLGLVALRWQDSLAMGTESIGRNVFNAALAIGLALACAKGAAWAGHRLAMAAGLATLAIPATSLMASAWPALAIAKPYVASYLWVDGLAALGGVALLLIAARARRRARGGEVQSVWRESSGAPQPAALAASPITQQLEQT